MTDVEAEFQAALTTARDALEQFKAEPLVASKRGGPRLSPWFRVWVQASEVAQRWHRQLGHEKPTPEDELDRLLAGGQEPEPVFERVRRKGEGNRADPRF